MRGTITWRPEEGWLITLPGVHDLDRNQLAVGLLMPRPPAELAATAMEAMESGSAPASDVRSVGRFAAVEVAGENQLLISSGVDASDGPWLLDALQYHLAEVGGTAVTWELAA